jgi:hypothetical protein
MGWGDLQNFLQHKKTQVVALCDVDDARAAGGKSRGPMGTVSRRRRSNSSQPS